jgi:hypothetical protein
MRSLTGLCTAAVILSFAAGAHAQARPDFSGKWIVDPASVPEAPAGAPAGGRGGRGGGAGFGAEFTAVQDAKTLKITRTQGDATVTATYNLDGSDSKNMAQGRGGQTEQVSKAAWDGSKLSITTTLDFGGNTVEQKRVLSLDGGNLVIEQTNPGRGGGEPTTVKRVYKKG